MNPITITKETVNIPVSINAWESVSPFQEAIAASGMKDTEKVETCGITPDGKLLISVKGDVCPDADIMRKFKGEMKLQIASSLDTGFYMDTFHQIADDNEFMLNKMDYSVFGLKNGWREENALFSFEAQTTNHAMKEWAEEILARFTHGQDKPEKNKKPTWSLCFNRDGSEVIWE